MKTRKFILFLCIYRYKLLLLLNNWYVKAGTSSENSGVNWESAISLNGMAVHRRVIPSYCSGNIHTQFY